MSMGPESAMVLGRVAREWKELCNTAAGLCDVMG